MRIAFLLSQSLENPSGLGRHWPLAKELARLGHKITILGLHPNLTECSRRHFSREGIAVHYVGQMHVRREASQKVYFSPGRLVINVLASTLRLAHALVRTDADLVQLCKAQPTNALAARLGQRGRPIFCDCDDYEAAINQVGAEWQRAVLRHFEDGVVGYARGLTVNTQFALVRYRDLGFPEARIVYVPNGVERSRFAGTPNPSPLRRRWSLNADEPLVVYLGTLGLRSHSTDLLLEAFRKVVEKLPSAQLLLVGGGEDYYKAKELAQRLGIADRTVFTGYVPPEAVPSYLSLATVSVEPVQDDVIARARSPLKVMESMAMGVPVVTGDVGDRRMLLGDDQPGVLVRPGDSQALAEGLLAVLQDPKARVRMAEAALVRREQWYWDRLIGDFIKVYVHAGLQQ